MHNDGVYPTCVIHFVHGSNFVPEKNGNAMQRPGFVSVASKGSHCSPSQIASHAFLRRGYEQLPMHQG